MMTEGIKKWNQDIRVFCFASGKALLEAYVFTMRFLDIDMTGINGIETGRQIRQGALLLSVV